MKRLLFLFGLLAGFLFAEMLRREELEELAELKLKQEKIRQHNQKSIDRYEEFYKTLPIEEQIDVAMRQAEWRFNLDDEDDDDPITEA